MQFENCLNLAPIQNTCSSELLSSNWPCKCNGSDKTDVDESFCWYWIFWLNALVAFLLHRISKVSTNPLCYLWLPISVLPSYSSQDALLARLLGILHSILTWLAYILSFRWHSQLPHIRQILCLRLKVPILQFSLWCPTRELQWPYPVNYQHSRLSSKHLIR